jgi:putative flippase GtrA
MRYYRLGLEQLQGRLKQLIAYGGVSIIALVADIVILIAVKEYIGLDYVRSAALGVLVGTTVHYALAKAMVFQGGRLNSGTFEFLAYAALGGIAMLVSLGIIILLTEHVGLDYRLSKIPAVFVSFFLGYALRNKLLFSENATSRGKKEILSTSGRARIDAAQNL